MSLTLKLLTIQTKLKAPKNQFNSFGKYKYRSCEDILEGVKPLLAKVGATLFLSDEVVSIDGIRYIKATAWLLDTESNDTISNTAYAREADSKKGMDASQITGTASSYARKYALNGLFCIDDTKDSDTDEYMNQQKNSPDVPESTPDSSNENATIATLITLKNLCEKYRIDFPRWLKSNGKTEETLTSNEAAAMLHTIRERFG